jgi:tRNA-Thr(GGU) m(6)t(6)A37 methyltransferase TsaA
VTEFNVRAVAHVESTLTDPAAAPKQGDEGAPEATIVFSADVADALADLETGTDVIVLTWLDRGRRDVLAVHPRGDESRQVTGVFSTRSPHRPNPIGLHRVTIVARDGLRITVRDLEAVDGTPVLDVKPVLGDRGDR